jgi:tetratricopeptide (TPR) repeat protein
MNGDAAGAELAFRKAAELAPNYTQIRWTLGNNLLRQGKTLEAFAEMRRAGENDLDYRNPLITTAWQIYEGDLEQVRQSIGNSATVNSALAVFMAKQKRFDEAVSIWDSLPDEEKKTTLKNDGGELIGQMMAEKMYRDALQIQRQISEPNQQIPVVGQISNGGFENTVNPADSVFFEWKIADGGEPRIGFDDREKNSGSRSLVIIFNSPLGREFRGVSQTVAVEAGKNYVFETFYKAELKTSASLYWEVTDASDGKILAATSPAAANANWTKLRAEFAAPEKTQSVVIRLAREQCKASLCPISGKIWFDDFSIAR